MGLFERIQQGDESAMGELVKAELPKIYNLCLRLTHNQEDAADLCQDAFVRALRGIKGFRGDAQIGTWLYRITVNTWKNRVRAEKRRKTHFHFSLFGSKNQDEDEQKTIELEDHTPTPEQQFQLNEDQKSLFEALNHLEEDEKTIVVLKDIEDKSYDEISHILELNVGTVKSRLSRARQHLREIHMRMAGKLT